MELERSGLLADDSLRGAEWCRAHSLLVDRWLGELFDAAGVVDSAGVALVAVGGYGRAELCPQSDIDVMLVHAGRRDIAAIADRIWYPIWDEGLHLGHSVCTVDEALGLAGSDLDTATAVLSARLVAGDPALATALRTGAHGQWSTKAKRWLTELGTRTEMRHQRSGEVAFQLEPDLKDGRGGLRDVHGLWWAQAAQEVLVEADEVSMAARYETLLDVRVELQRHTGRAINVLALQDQAEVARALGLSDEDVLMARVSEAARAIAWTSDDTWRRIRTATRGPLRRLANRSRSLGNGLHLRDGEVHADIETGRPVEPAAVLDAAVTAAQNHTVIDRSTLEALATSVAPMNGRWPSAMRDRFVELLAAGRPAIGVIESLDQRGLWTLFLPEWEPVRARPQRNAYHRFTVDRHLLETTANASRLTGGVARPDLLVLGALLHDIGKGHPGDHAEVGVVLAGSILDRLGFDADDAATVQFMIEHHLLLPDVATRRDLDDPHTIERVAATIGTTERLELLAALTEADSLATGSSAWGPWKAELVQQLVARVAHVLGGDPTGAPAVDRFPSAEQLEALAQPGQRVVAAGETVTVMTDDRPRIFCRIAGVLALHGLDVASARAHSTEDRALAEFLVHHPVGREIHWDRVVTDLDAALDGRLAIDARLADRARTYRPSSARALPGRTDVRVTFDDQASVSETVIDVEAPDSVGVLYRITRALSDLDLDIRAARIHTTGPTAQDSFYVRNRHGARIDDRATCDEIARAVAHSIGRP